MDRYLLTKEHFTEGHEWCYRSCLFTVETDISREIWDIVKTDAEAELDEFIERAYGRSLQLRESSRWRGHAQASTAKAQPNRIADVR